MKKSSRFVLSILLLLATAMFPTSIWAEQEKNDAVTSPAAQTPSGKGSIVIRTVHENDFPTLATVPLQQAIQTALTRTPGGLLKAETKAENGFLVHHIEVVAADKSITEFTIDAGNGVVLSQSRDKPDDDKEGEHEDDDDDD